MRSLTLKLVFAFLAVSLSGTILLAALTRQNTVNDFGSFMLNQNQSDLTSILEDYYRTNGSWSGVESQVQSGGMGMMGTGGNRGSGGNYALADAAGIVIIGDGGHPRGEQLSQADLSAGKQIQLEGGLVGTVIFGRDQHQMASPEGDEFLMRINTTLILASLGATALALLLSAWLARSLTRPLSEIIAATRAVSEGDLKQQVPVRSSDEIGELAVSFNQMSTDLAAARDLRRQMTADIAHELRTPLSIILGHSEAIRDEVLSATPETITIIHDEALRLNRMVNDLRILSLADVGELELVRSPIKLESLLQHVSDKRIQQAKQQNISLQTDLATNLPQINVDADRIVQVLVNLVDNAFRHTPSGGSVTLAASLDSNTSAVIIVVRDTGSGISTEDLPHIFDRFYRSEKARERDRGGAGLGLAIARSMIHAHGGQIKVESKPGKGSTFTILLPT